MQLREAKRGDLPALLALYTQFKNTPLPEADERILQIWDQILQDENHHVIVGTSGGQIVSSCVIVIVPNLTHNQRPYALIENVITDEAHRKNGYASAVLEYAKNIAKQADCYKVMLMTGSKLESTLRFYERAGFNRTDKTGFVFWLD
jgi:N-acetylglutamate synthase-like GNAT family acetyltransferase